MKQTKCIKNIFLDFVSNFGLHIAFTTVCYCIEMNCHKAVKEQNHMEVIILRSSLYIPVSIMAPIENIAGKGRVPNVYVKPISGNCSVLVDKTGTFLNLVAAGNVYLRLIIPTLDSDVNPKNSDPSSNIVRDSGTISWNENKNFIATWSG